MKHLSQLLLMSLALTLSLPAWALKSDRDQPADIEADNTEIDFRTGVRTLTGNVLIVQGTLRLKADKLVGQYTKGELTKATAWGSPARFKQRPDGKPDDVEGAAKKIVVDYASNTLTLFGKASLKQGENTARGDTITYNMATDKLQIKGNSGIGTAGKNGATKPKRKLEDPFKDDDNKAAETKKNGKKAKKKPTVNTVPSGRSRLIIQPKPKPKKKKPAKTDAEQDETNEDDTESTEQN